MVPGYLEKAVVTPRKQKHQEPSQKQSKGIPEQMHHVKLENQPSMFKRAQPIVNLGRRALLRYAAEELRRDRPVVTKLTP